MSVRAIVEEWFDKNEDSSDAGYSAISRDKLEKLIEEIESYITWTYL
jgi:hypothetical protein